MIRGKLASRSLLVMAMAAALSTAAVLPAAAGGHGQPSNPPPKPTVIASGLNNPRQLSFGPDGSLYVAEAGSGGSGPCFTGGEGSTVCYGTSGSITRISPRGKQSRVLTRLPSIGNKGTPGNLQDPAGGESIGAADVKVIGNGKLAVLFGLGTDPANRAGLPASGQRLGTLAAVDVKSGRSRQIADIAGFEARRNPIHNPDSDPAGMLEVHGRYQVADAGGNDVVKVARNGKVRLLAVLVDGPPVPAPPDGSLVAPQSVPTSVAIGPDGATYVSQLTGFPFPKGGANIYRIGRDGKPRVYASGLTNVTDLAWSGHTLYAVQLSTNGLLTGPMGSLVKISHRGATPQVVVDNLFAPYGIAIRGHYAYLTTGSVVPSVGQVMRIPLG